MAETPSATGETDPDTEVLGGARPVEPANEPRAPLIGRTLGKFTIVERLGRGGSGEVFRADQAPLGRSAVVKVLRPDLAPSPHRVERFLREARLASTLDHPYAGHIYAFGAEPDGVLWIAMEHVRGTTLAEMIAKRGPIPAAVFAPVFERLCEVVHSAHERGIVHRDIKLANVMVIERSGQLLPKLLDFGVAKLGGADAVSPGVATADTATGSLTSHGATIGSPPYMAPEQWLHPHDVDGRADIYALGVLAYRCLSGRPPIQGNTLEEFARAHLEAEPPPLGVGAPALDGAIRRALAKLRDQRWPGALDFAAAVRNAIGPGVGEAVPILDPVVRATWEAGGPQPIAEAVAQLAAATTTATCDDAVRDLVDVACRWLAAVALSGCAAERRRGAAPAALAALRDRTRELARHDGAADWLDVARAACAVAPAVPELPGVLAAAGALAELAVRHGRGRHARSPAEVAVDVAAVGGALAPLDPLLAYDTVVGGERGPEIWSGTRHPSRTLAMVWGDPIAAGDVVLLDDAGRAAVRLSPLVRAWRPLPHGDVELFVIARAGRGAARLAATPWAFECDDAEAGAFLAGLATPDAVAAADADDEAPPYPGLAAYGVEDAARFFGREREIDALANRLVRAPMVAVVGPSGVGKSSFVHAGLVARLREHHRVITLRPGRHPIEALHAAIERDALGPFPASAVPEDAALVQRLCALGDRSERGVVVIVDQLEELSTLCADAGERDRFARVIAAAASGAAAPVRVVATLRDDFASLIESIDELRDRFEVFVLGAPSPAALRRIVIEPARRAGVGVEPGLVDEIVGEIAGRAAALPLLGFTAARLWQLRDREARVLTRTGYQAIGGVAGALATYADEVFASLAAREQAIAREVFARLVAADGTRVPMARAELAVIDGSSGVVDRLIDARLLTAHEARPEPREPAADPGDPGEELIEIVHECLAERWPRLVRWRSEDAADRALLGDVRAAARRWHDQRRPDDLLWRGAALHDLRRLVDKAAFLTAREREFAAASLGAARRRRLVRRAIAGVVIVGAVGVAVVMSYLMRVADRNADHAAASEQTARGAAALAESRLTQQLRAAGQRELSEGHPVQALAYLGEVLRRGVDDDGIRLMIGQTAWAWPYELATRDREQLIAGAVDGSWFAIAKAEVQGVTIVDDHGAELGRLAVDSWISNVKLDFAQQRILVFSQRAVGVADRSAPDRVTQVFANAPNDAPWAGCFGPGRDEITTTGAWAIGEIRVHGLDGTLRRKLVTGVQTRGEPLCSPDGSHLLQSGPDRTVLVDLATMKVALDTRANITSGGFARTGRLVLSSMDGEIQVYEPDGGLHAKWPTAGGDHNTRISADGTRIGFADDHGMIVYDPEGHERLRLGGWDSGIGSIAFDGDEIWTGGDDGIVRRWRSDGVQLAALIGAGGDVREVVRTPSGVAAFASRGARWWKGVPQQVDTADDGACVYVGLIVARDRPMAASQCNAGRLALWDFDDPQGPREIRPYPDLRVTDLEVDGQRFATWSHGSPLQIWDRTGALVREVPVETDTSVIGWVGGRVWVVVWKHGEAGQPDYRSELYAVDPATGARTDLEFDPDVAIKNIVGIDASLGILVSDEGELLVIRDGALVKRVPTGVSQVGEVTALVDVAARGGRFAIASLDGDIRVLALPDLTEVRRIRVPGDAISSMTLDPDGATLVVVTADRHATAWSVADGTPIARLEVGDVPVAEAYFAGRNDELIAYVGNHLSRVHVPRATGTAAELAAELACRVRFRPEGGELVPTEPSCPAK